MKQNAFSVSSLRNPIIWLMLLRHHVIEKARGDSLAKRPSCFFAPMILYNAWENDVALSSVSVLALDELLVQLCSQSTRCDDILSRTA